MHIQDSDFDIDLVSEPIKSSSTDEPVLRDAYQIRRMIERLSEIKQLRALLGDPEFNDFE